MKRHISFLLAVVLLFSLDGCGDSESTADDSNSPYVSLVQSGYLGQYDDITVKELLSGHYGILYEEETWDGGTTDSGDEIVQVKFHDSDDKMEDVTIQFKMLNEQCFRVTAFVDPMETVEKSTELFATLNFIYLEQYILHNKQTVDDFEVELVLIQRLNEISGSAVVYGAASNYSGDRAMLCELENESPLDVSVPYLLDHYGLIDLNYYVEGDFEKNPLEDPSIDEPPPEDEFEENPLADSTVEPSPEITPTPNVDTPTPTVSKTAQVFETDYYTITIPASWEGQYEYEKHDNTLAFYERESYEYGYGGFLFRISLEEDESFREIPSYSELGALIEPSDEDKISPFFIGYMIVSYPTDVQFSEDTEEAYIEMSEEIDAILSTLSPVDGYELIS